MSPTIVPRVLASALTVVALGGCTAVSGIRRPPPTTAPATTASRVAPRPLVSARLPDGFGELSAEVPIPPGYVQNSIQFVDPRHGYALFTKCGVPTRSGRHNDCRAALVTTVDGGVHWRALAYPEPVADSHRLQVGADGTVVLSVEPLAWFVSHDAGRTFTRTAVVDGPPAAEHTLAGRYEICCDDQPAPGLRRWTGETSQPVDTYLSGRLFSVAEQRGRGVWVSGVDDGSARTAFSADDGRTWTELPVDGPTSSLIRSQVLTSPGGDDVWLLGWTADHSGIAEVWWLDGARQWRRIQFGRSTAYEAAVPTGSSRLVLTGTQGSIQLSANLAEEPADWPAGAVIRRLPGAAVQVDDAADGSTWLGTGDPAQPSWTRIRLRPVGA